MGFVHALEYTTPISEARDFREQECWWSYQFCYQQHLWQFQLDEDKLNYPTDFEDILTSDGLFFVVKEVLLDQGNQGIQSLYQLEQEVALLSQFEHENIVQYYGIRKVCALQRLGSHFENLSRHERSCILAGQHRTGRRSYRTNGRSTNPDDDNIAC
uniref:Protein kinase domain-containing protein n=1 Tax=Nelumbo nucifera TaxID=4432 RepID=A0A822XL17_NELNU|nr:TPA_asm: hypothetical protein HUJ06_023767 [Nelumbo nucifera]